VVLDEWRKVLTCKVVEELDKEKESLSEEREGCVGGKCLARRSREELIDVLHELKMRLAEATEDIVDLGEELVGAELGAPAVTVSSDSATLAYRPKME
jgi:hypothetical protein